MGVHLKRWLLHLTSERRFDSAEPCPLSPWLNCTILTISFWFHLSFGRGSASRLSKQWQGDDQLLRWTGAGLKTSLWTDKTGYLSLQMIPRPLPQQCDC